MRRTFKHLSALVAACLLLVANPAFFGCAEEDEEGFDFGESEMRTFIEGTWTGSMTLDGTATPLTLALAQAANPTSAAGLCGERSFVAPAAACVAMSTMPVSGTLSTDDGRFSAVPVTGNLEVFGASFDNAQLYLTLGDSMSFNIGSASGESFDHDGQIYGATAQGTFTLARAAR